MADQGLRRREMGDNLWEVGKRPDQVLQGQDKEAGWCWAEKSYDLIYFYVEKPWEWEDILQSQLEGYWHE